MSDSLPRLNELRVAHNRLLRRYFELLGAVSTVPLLYKNLPPRTTTSHELNPVVNETMRPRALGFIVRYLVHSHIRVKLGELATAYKQLQYMIKLQDPGTSDLPDQQGYRDFLQTACETCLELRDSVGSWSARGGLVALTSPLALALLGLLGNSVFKAPSHFTIFLSAALIFYTVLYFEGWFRSSFLSKRNLFLASSSWGSATPSGHENRSAYYLEDELFKLLHIGKRRELPLDLLGVELELVLTVAIVASLSAYEVGGLPLLKHQPELWRDAAYVSIATLATIVGALGVLVHHVRGLLRRKDER
jgi:hypothetical protein